MTKWKNTLVGKALNKVGNWFKNLGIGNWWRSATGQTLSNAQQEANAFSANEAEKAREFEQQMSNTSYQRQVADMRAAGVNPALMYGSGASGASTPSSPAPSSVDPSGPSLTPLGLLNQIQQLSLLKAQKDNIKANTAGKLQEIKESDERINQIRASTAHVLKDIDVIDANVRKIGLEGDALEVANKYISQEKDAELRIAGLKADQIQVEIQHTNKKIENLDRQNLEILQRIAESKVQIRKLLSETELNKQQVDYLKHLSDKVDADKDLILKKTTLLEKDINWYVHDKIAGDVSVVTGGISNIFGIGKLFGKKGAKGSSTSFLDTSDYLGY